VTNGTALRLDSPWVKRIAPAALFQFLFVAAVALLKPAINAMVLSRFQSTALPFLYLGTSAVSLFLALIPAVTKRLTVVRVSLLFAVSSLLLLFGVSSGWALLVLLSFLVTEVLSTQVSMVFWKSVGESFDARESRRAFASINGVGMSGAIAGGFIATVGAKLFGVWALTALGALLLLAAAASFRGHKNLLGVEKRRFANTSNSFSDVFSQGYTRNLLYLVVGLAILSPAIDFVFRQRISSQLQETAMASVFGAHQLFTGVFCVVFQLLASETLIRRLGLVRYVASLPLMLALMLAVSWIWPSVWSVWILKVLEGATSWSILPVAMQLLYAPLPDATREGSRRLIDGVFRKAGLGIAALAILILQAGSQYIAVSHSVFALSLVLATTLVFTVSRMGRQYVEVIAHRVSGRDETVESIDTSVLVQSLSNPLPEKALRAASLLEQTDAVDIECIRLLLKHPDERVQERGVEWTLEHQRDDLSDELVLLTKTTARRPRDAATWALATLDSRRALQVLPHNLSSSEVGLKCASVGGLLVIDPQHELARRELNALIVRLPTAPAAERRELARLVGRLGDETLSSTLNRSLDDTDPSVRRVAIAAVGQGRFVSLAPKLLKFLSWRDERASAREALTRLGDEVVPLLKDSLNDRSRALALRLQLPRLLKRIETQESFEALLFSNAEDEPSLHHRVGEALAQLNEIHPDFTLDEKQIFEALERRKAHCLSLVSATQICRNSLGKHTILARILTNRMEQSVRVSFSLLGLSYGGRGMRRAQAHLLGTDQKRAAWASEFLDATLTSDERELINVEINALRKAKEVQSGTGLNACLTQLTQSEDTILRCCARFVARARNQFPKEFKGGDMNEAILKKLFALEGVDIFAQSEIDDLTALAGVAKEVAFSKGELVYSEGDPGDALFVIYEGAVVARREGEVLMTLRAKESFGETSLFDGAPRINEVLATEDTKMLVIDRRDFLDLLSDRPELLAGMFRVMSRQLKSLAVEVATRRATTGDFPMMNVKKV
jgi:HEAT repeat protein